MDTIEARNITECARCGENHDKMTFNKFTKPSGKNTHWGMCPVVNEPLLMYSTPKPTSP